MLLHKGTLVFTSQTTYCSAVLFPQGRTVQCLRDHNNPQVLDNAWEMLFGENDGNIVTVRLPEDAKIKELDYPDAEEIQKIKKQGYDGPLSWKWIEACRRLSS